MITNQVLKNTSHKKQAHFLMQENFTKEEKLLLLHLKMVYFHCINNTNQRVIGQKTRWIHQNFCL